MPYSLLLGFLTPLLPIFGSGYLLLLCLFFLLLQAFQGKRWNATWMGALLLVFGTWTFAEIVWSIDWEVLKILWRGTDGPGLTGYRNFLWSVYYSPPLAVLHLEAFLRFFCFAGLCSFFAGHQKAREHFMQGLELGLAVSAVLTTFVLAYPDIIPLTNQTPFWTSIQRTAGTFSDPNAFGIFVVLALPLLLWRILNCHGIHRIALCGLGLVWLVLGAYAGSRSYFLGLAIYLLLYAFSRGRQQGFGLLAGGISGIGILNLSAILFPAAFAHVISALPQGAIRTISTLLVEHWDKSFFSRFVFWEIGWNLWLDNFFFGSGFERFHLYVPQYAAKLGIGTGLWSDNSNNFYLGTLAETGVIGAIALILSLTALHWRNERPNLVLRAPLFALVILLFVGPHLSFDEVSVLGALLIALTCDVRPLRIRPSFILVGAVFLVGIFVKSSLLMRGFYAWEVEDSTPFRWVARSSSGELGCDENAEAKLEFRALNPDISIRPLTVVIRSSAPPPRAKELAVKSSKVQQSLQISDSSWHIFSFHCPALYSHTSQVGKVRYTLESDRIWVPKKYGLGDDNRRLGVQVRLP